MNPAPQLPRPRFIAPLLAVAALVLAAGASVGPVGARCALVRAGKSRPQPPATGLVD